MTLSDEDGGSPEHGIHTVKVPTRRNGWVGMWCNKTCLSCNSNVKEEINMDIS